MIEYRKESKIIKRTLSEVKEYSEKDIVLFIESYLKNVFCGDYFHDCPWGIAENERLYIAIFEIERGKLKEYIEKRKYSEYKSCRRGTRNST